MVRRWRVAVAVLGVVAVGVACGSPPWPGPDGVCSPGSLQQPLRVCADGGRLTGIDVSRYQGNVNWGLVAQDGHSFAIARISDGLNYPDSYFAQNWTGMAASGLVRGAYQFFRSNQDPISQADMVLDALQAAGGLGASDLPVVLDLESSDGQSNATVVANARQWLAHIESATGKRPLVYSAAFMSSVIGDGLSDYPLWVANYTTSCPLMPTGWTQWVMWQNSSTGSVSGISGNVDMNVFNGDISALQRFANAGTLPWETGPWDGGTPDAAMPVDAGMAGTCTQVQVSAEVGALNIRPQPNTSQAPVGTLQPGELANVLGSAQGQAVYGQTLWWLVDSAAAIQGYISAYYAACVAWADTDGGPPADAGTSANDGGFALDAGAAALDAATLADAAMPTDAATTAADAATPVDGSSGAADAADAVADAGSSPPEQGQAMGVAGNADTNAAPWCR